MLIADIISTRSGEVISATVDEKVRDVAARLAERRIGAVPVIDGDRLVGIFSERDVIYGLARDGEALLDRPISEAMTVEVVTVDPETRILTAISLMTRRRIRHLPVVVDGRMEGIVSIGDLVKSRIDAIEAEAEAMREYIQRA